MINRFTDQRLRDNFETHNDSTISSDKSIPEEIEDSSVQFLTSKSDISRIDQQRNATERASLAGGPPLTVANSTKLTYSQSIQTTEKASGSIVMRNSNLGQSTNQSH